MADASDPKNTAVKPGILSSEFLLTLVLQVAGFILYSGMVHCDDNAPIVTWGSLVVTQALLCKGAGVVLALASALGYQYQRGWVKTSANDGAVAATTASLNLQAAQALASGGKPPADPQQAPGSPGQ